MINRKYIAKTLDGYEVHLLVTTHSIYDDAEISCILINPDGHISETRKVMVDWSYVEEIDEAVIYDRIY